MTAAHSGQTNGSEACIGYATAGLGRRWCALVYEALLLLALCLVAGFAALPIIGPSHAGPVYAAHQLYLLPPASSAFLFILYVAILGIYCIGFWSSGRRTLGMRTWGLALLTRDGQSLDVSRATKRYFATWIGAAAGLAGYWLVGGWGLLAGLLNYYWGWVDADRQFLQDRIAGTRLIRLRLFVAPDIGSPARPRASRAIPPGRSIP